MRAPDPSLAVLKKILKVAFKWTIDFGIVRLITSRKFVRGS